MKSLRLSEVEVSIAALPGMTPVNKSTIDMLRVVMRDTGGNGVSLEDLRKRMRVIDAIEEAAAAGLESLVLEDADADTLQRCARSVKWTAVQADVLAFAEAIEGMSNIGPIAWPNAK